MHGKMTPVADKLLSIEMARGIAAAIVVFYHAARHFDKDVGFPLGRQAFQFGHAGVDFFFVISGFIILFIHIGDFGRPGRLVHYALRRCTRIYPIYWVILAVTVAIALVSSHHLPPSPFDVVWAALLLPTSGEPIVGVSWTLQHEVIFYVLFATLILHRRMGAAVLVAWFAVIVVGLAGGWTIPPSAFFSAYNLEFLFGMGAALWLRRGTVPFARTLFALGLSSFAAAAAEVFGLLDGYAPWARLAYGVPSALIVLGLVEMERQGAIAVPSRLLWLGRASYSIYLFHLTWIGLSYKLWTAGGLAGWAPPWAGFGLVAAAGIGGGVLVSVMIEYPLMRQVRRGLRRVDGASRSHQGTRG